MKVLTIHQPYATLIFTPGRNGMAKGWETRPKPCPPSIIGTRIAIHAAVKPPKAEYPGKVGDWIAVEYPDAWWLREKPWRDQCREVALPLGAIIGTVVIAESLPIEGANMQGYDEFVCPHVDGALTLYRFGNGGHRPATTSDDITDQVPYGYWVDGNHAWRLTDPEPLAEPVPFTGGQGWSKTWEPT